MNPLEKEYREYFQNLTKEEMKALLEEAGFDVQDGSGKINFLADTLNFTVKGKFNTRKANVNREISYSFPKAS